jgi:primase-polymerase (primpol)-like protein
MKFELPFILKSRIDGAITRARMDERDKAEREYTRQLSESIRLQKDVYEIKLKEKDAEIKTLEKVIEDKDRHVAQANKRFHDAKLMIVKAKALVLNCDYFYKCHVENEGRLMTSFDDMRLEIESFAKEMIGE